MGAKAEITASVPAGVHWRASPEGMPLWGPNRFWPGSGLVLRCLGPGFTVLALGPGFRPIIIIIIISLQPVAAGAEVLVVWSLLSGFAFAVVGLGFEVLLVGGSSE